MEIEQTGGLGLDSMSLCTFRILLPFWYRAEVPKRRLKSSPFTRGYPDNPDLRAMLSWACKVHEAQAMMCRYFDSQKHEAGSYFRVLSQYNRPLSPLSQHRNSFRRILVRLGCSFGYNSQSHVYVERCFCLLSMPYSVFGLALLL